MCVAFIPVAFAEESIWRKGTPQIARSLTNQMKNSHANVRVPKSGRYGNHTSRFVALRRPDNILVAR